MSEREPSPKHAHHHHRKDAAASVATVVISVSDTRTLETDTGGALVAELLENSGHAVLGRQTTPAEAEFLLDRVIPGFGELFRQLSYASIGSAAMLSRALAGVVGGRVVFVLPGSRGAVLLGMEQLILPELGHLASEAVKTR